MAIEEEGIYLFRCSWNSNACSLCQFATQIWLVFKRKTLSRKHSSTTAVWLWSFIIAIIISISIYTHMNILTHLSGSTDHFVKIAILGTTRFLPSLMKVNFEWLAENLKWTSMFPLLSLKTQHIHVAVHLRQNNTPWWALQLSLVLHKAFKYRQTSRVSFISLDI